MGQPIAIGICTTPERAPLVAPYYDYIELSLSTVLDPLQDDETFAPALEALHKLPLPARACNNFVNPRVKLVGPDVDWGLVESYVERGFRRAQALGIERIVFGSGGARMVPEGYSRETAWEQLVRFCRLCAERAYAGLTLAIEPLNRGECNILNSYGEGVALARDVDRPNIRVLADIYHFEVESEPVEAIRPGADVLAHVHLADSGRLYPGSGSYPLRAWFALLHELGYDQRASVECTWGEDFAAEAQAAAAFLRPLARGEV
jgi:sugar phosphate isomerase/epimerase